MDVGQKRRLIKGKDQLINALKNNKAVEDLQGNVQFYFIFLMTGIK